MTKSNNLGDIFSQRNRTTKMSKKN